MVFCIKQKTAYELRISDWSSDVCSSDLKMNGILQDIGRGTHKYVAARYTFRRLFLTGLTALLTNIVGFAVLVIIDIPVIRDLALTRSEEHTSELQSLMRISYAVFCLKKKINRH